MQIAIYARVSTQRQAQFQTTEPQLERLLARAQVQGWNLPPERIYRDDGYSGASLRRPGLDRLRNAVASCAPVLQSVDGPPCSHRAAAMVASA